MSQTKDPREVLNLHKDNSEFVIATGVGRTIQYHGLEVDLTRIQRAKAEEIANDKRHAYISYSDARQKEVLAQAQAAAQASAGSDPKPKK